MKNFTLFKNENKKSDKQPDYTMSGKVGEEYQDIGACWVKEGKKGKYLSCSLQDARSYENKDGVQVEVPSFSIVEEKGVLPQESSSKPSDEINPDDIGF